MDQNTPLNHASFNDTSLDMLAERVNNRYQKSLNPSKYIGNYTQVMVDPATMIMIVKILIEVIRLVRKCRTEKEIVSSAKRPSRFDKMVLRRIIRKRLSLPIFLSKGRALSQAVCEAGADLNEEQVFQLLEEVSD